MIKARPKSIAGQLRFMRERANLSQAQLARCCKVSRQYIGAIEAGHKEPSVAVLRTICGTLRHLTPSPPGDVWPQICFVVS